MAAPAMAQKVRAGHQHGDIVIELDAAKAPKTVDNFLQYVKAGHYDGTVFHRVIDDFMIQGGGMNADMQREADRRTDRARKPQRPEQLSAARWRWRARRYPNSATAQFFINLKDNTFLDSANSRDGNGYAVFGKVVVGHGRGRQDPRRAHGQQGPAPETCRSTPVDRFAKPCGEMTMTKTVELQTSAGTIAHRTRRRARRR